MPFKSEKQKRLMEAVAHNPKIAASRSIPQSVAKKLIKDDNAKNSALSLRSRFMLNK